MMEEANAYDTEDRTMTWHVTGSQRCHSCPIRARLIREIQTRWPRQDFTPAITTTGYLDDCTDNIEENHWTEDTYGRCVFKHQGKVVFQRYRLGHIMMCGTRYPYSQIFTLEEAEAWLHELESE